MGPPAAGGFPFPHCPTFICCTQWYLSWRPLGFPLNLPTENIPTLCTPFPFKNNRVTFVHSKVLQSSLKEHWRNLVCPWLFSSPSWPWFFRDSPQWFLACIWESVCSS